jgi:hypothetical protein
MFSEIEDIRKEIAQNISDICTDDDKQLKKYFAGFKKITRTDAEDAVKYFLGKVRDDIDSRLSGYLYNEARALKDIIDREE